jgi:hypothetical protein
MDGNLYVDVSESDRDSWLILKFGRVEGAGICDYTAAGVLLAAHWKRLDDRKGRRDGHP